LVNHELYMHRCLQLASLGAGNVAPNPMVGAVLVYDHVIIGEGYHRNYGFDHAEVECLKNVPDHNRHLISKSTLYVSLEPCNHFGKTPPCSDLIIRHSIPRVVIACKDPFEKVNGSGIEKLQSNGIDVITCILEKEAQELNKRFFTFHQKKRPYIILKWAQSKDHKITAEDQYRFKISNEISDRLVHKWRSEEASIMVGTNTALTDNPSLTTRLWKGNNPVRIVIDKFLKIPVANKLLDKTVQTIIINTIRNDVDGNNVFYKITDNENMIPDIMNMLYQRNIISLFVEGGTHLLGSFIDTGLWDEMRVITNKELNIGNGKAAPFPGNDKPHLQVQYLSDEISYYKHSI